MTVMGKQMDSGILKSAGPDMQEMETQERVF